jgi:hypothetical protein
MKLFFAGAFAFVGAGLAIVSIASSAQTAAQAPQPPQQAGQQTVQQSGQGQPKGQVIFSRSVDENGEVVGQSRPAAAHPEIKAVDAPVAEDADRRAIGFTDIDLTVHLRPAAQQIAVRAELTVRNDGKTPLARIPLQISSSLNWERILIDGRDAALTVATLNSDTDHTGQLHEAAVPLAAPLAPGATARLDATYFGTIPQDAKRLLAVGTPDEVAIRSDWDEIGDGFTGLRGFGNVVWYPVASVPVILGDGARVFDEIGSHKLRLAGARFRLRLTVEFAAGHAPNLALVNGIPAPLAVTDATVGGELSGIATADSGATTLGFEAPSLFVAARTPHASANVNLWTIPEDASAVGPWNDAAAAVTPFLQDWLGKRTAAQLTVLDLPDARDAPFETGSMLAAPVRQATPDELKGVLVHALTHAYLRDGAQASPAWLDEGVATFIGTLWVEKQQGREKALETLESARPALALAEPGSPGENPGQPLAAAISPVYYRTKAAYVLWMLRDIVDDPALSAALRAWIAPAANQSAGAPRATFEKLLEQADGHRDLSWFFADWVDADHGLPDLAIDSVFPNAVSADSWLVAVNLSNAGYAAAEVPLTVRSMGTSVTQRVMIPARGKVSQRILIQGKPVSVQLNDGAVPETEASVHETKLDQPGAGAAPGLGEDQQ